MSIASFAEETCWDGDQPRINRKSVMFRITSPGKVDGVRLDHTFEASFGIWYDPDDHQLLDQLRSLDLGINWDRFVFWRKLDHSGIDVLEIGEEEKVVATIIVRRRLGGDSSGEPDRTNVTCLTEFRLARSKTSGEIGETND